MKRIFIFLAVAAISLAAYVFALSFKEMPELRSGDLVFHTSGSNQSAAILFATLSPYTHMGIVRVEGTKVFVQEAAGTVREVSFEEWKNRGILNRIAIFRHADVTPDIAKKILHSTQSHFGKTYDIFFSFKNKTLYCSELPYLAFQNAGVDLGEVQKVSDLNFDNPLVKKLIEQRWERNPECREQKLNFEKCYTHILEQDLITPASVAADDKLEKIYSNYPL